MLFRLRTDLNFTRGDLPRNNQVTVEVVEEASEKVKKRKKKDNKKKREAGDADTSADV